MIGLGNIAAHHRGFAAVDYLDNCVHRWAYAVSGAVGKLGTWSDAIGSLHAKLVNNAEVKAAVGALDLEYDTDDTATLAAGDHALTGNTGSVCAWVQVESLADVFRVGILGFSDGSNYNRFMLSVRGSDAGKIDFTWDNGTNVYSTISSTDSGLVVAGNGWQHIACVRNGGTSGQVYLDGQPIATTASLAATNWQNASQGFLGEVQINQNNRRWDGLLDEIRMYDSVLTDAQVLAIYNATKGTHA